MYGVDARFCPTDGSALTTPNVDDDPLIGQKLDGRYLVLRKIAVGGMGAVYEGVQLSIDRPVAIKIIRDIVADSPRERQRFWLEARAVSRLEHDNVVRVYDYGTDQEKNPFLVMELLRGESLADRLVAKGLPMDPSQAAAIVYDACKGLGAAHEAGLIHRDIKPSNLWIAESARPNDPVTVKVLDFGLVKSGEVSIYELTTGGETVGTPSYMSPEQVEGRSNITGSADLYALSVVFFELVVGHAPYAASTVTDTLMAHLTKPIPRPDSAINGSALSPAIQEIWMRGLAKKASERFLDAAEMMAALRPLVEADGTVSDPSISMADTAAVMETMHAETESHLQVPSPDRSQISSRSLLSREKKLVTVVTVRAADHPGKARADLEERLEALDPLIAQWSEDVALAGGVVTPVEGQGIRAVFGLPTAGEADNCTALRVAFGLSKYGESIADAFAVQVGIHTCSVLVQGSDDTVGGYRIVGEAYDIAEAAAAAGAPDGGSPVLTGPAYRGLQRFLRESLQPVGELQGDPFSGTTDKEILASREISLDISRPKPFVGRADELESLESWVEHTLATRQSAFCLVTGEAGVGKSHMLVELGRRMTTRWPDMQFLMAAHDGHGHVPFSLFRAMLLGATGPAAGSAGASISRWVSTVLSAHNTNFDQGVATDLLRLVGLAAGSEGDDANPEGWRQRVFGIMADLCGGLATRGGLVLLVDDVHDTDAGSIELLHHITRTLSDFPVLVVGFGRSLNTDKLSVNQELTLGPLSEEESRFLAIDLLGKGRAVAGLTERILDRAEGNPLFIEELARAAGDLTLQGELPTSLHALLQARYDAQPANTRQVLQQASVVGRTFWTATVDAQRSEEERGLLSTDAMLESLAQAGLIALQDRNLYAGHETWRFAQNLMQEVAYASALNKDRRAGHSAVADWILAQVGDPPPAHYPLLATQLEGADRDKEAARAWLRAANDARDRFANQAAADGYGKALTLQTDWEETERLHVLLGYGMSLESIGAIADAERAYTELAESEDADATDRTYGLLYLGRLAGRAGQPGLQEDLQRQAFAIVKGGEKRAQLQVAADYGYALSRSGGHREAERIVQEALASVDETAQVESLWVSLANLHLVQGILERNRGDLNAAERSIRKALLFFERAAHPSGQASTLISLCVSLRELGQYDEAAECAQRAGRFFREAGHQGHEMTATLNLGWCHLDGGDLLKAKRVFQRARDAADPGLPRIHRIFLDAGDGLTALGLSQLDVADERADSCMRLIDGDVPTEDRGWALYAAGKIRGDIEILQQSAACWRELERPVWLARTLDVLVDLGVADSAVVAERDQARATLATARDRIKEEAA